MITQLQTRTVADEQAKATTEAAVGEAEAVRAEAEDRLREAEEQAAARTRGIEQEIADLVRKRRDVVANLEQLNAEMKLAIDGPGEKDLGLSERVEAAVDDPEMLEPELRGPETEIVAVDEEGTADLAMEQADRDRRRRSVDSVDPPTDDQKLTELL